MLERIYCIRISKTVQRSTSAPPWLTDVPQNQPDPSSIVPRTGNEVFSSHSEQKLQDERGSSNSKTLALRGQSGQKQAVSMGGSQKDVGDRWTTKDPINFSTLHPRLVCSSSCRFQDPAGEISLIRTLIPAEGTPCRSSALADLHAGRSQDEYVLAFEPKHC